MYSLFVPGLYTFLSQLGKFTFGHHLPSIVSNEQTLKMQFLEQWTTARHLAHHMAFVSVTTWSTTSQSCMCVCVRVCVVSEHSQALGQQARSGFVSACGEENASHLFPLPTHFV